MRSARSEHIIIAILLVVPLAVAFFGWPAFVRWAAGPPPEAAATQVPEPVAAAPAATPTRAPQAVAAPPRAAAATPVTRATEAPAQLTPTAQEEPRSTRAQQSAPAALPAEPAAADPGAAVQDFYARVAEHDFAGAAALWSPQMRASYPPSQNIDARFSQTHAVTVNRAEVVSQDPAGSRATVAVDLTESASDGQHHWTGQWQLVHGPSGWLLDQPSLQGR